jgi:hypothetical protein
MRAKSLCFIAAAATALAMWTHPVAAEANKQRHISNKELTMEKSGRVVDAETGIGIAGVKVIVDWNTLSTGIPGYSSTGGAWCDLQRIATTDESGNYTIPDVTKELDLSDRGTHFGKTPFGLASQTHDKDYVMAAFKPGYVPAGDMEIVKESMEYAKKRLISGLSLAKIPDVSFGAGKVVIRQIVLRKVDLSWPDLWAYYRMVPLGCEDRMAHFIEQPEAAEILQTIRTTIGPMPCAMAPTTSIDAQSFGIFVGLSPADTVRVIERVKRLDGIANPDHFDPQESITTTAATLCRATQEDSAK